MPNVKLPDGSVRQFDQPVAVAAVAAAIGPGLAKAALGGKVNGALVDTSFVIDKDSDLAIITDKKSRGPGSDPAFDRALARLRGERIVS